MAHGGRTTRRQVVARGHEHGRAGEQHPVVVGPGDGEASRRARRPVRHVLAGGVPRDQPVGQRRGDHHRARAGAAGPGLARAPLVDAHGDVPLAAAYDELDVDAVGVGRRVVRRRVESLPASSSDSTNATACGLPMSTCRAGQLRSPTPTARSPRCAATASGSSRGTWSTRAWSRRRPIPIATRDGVKTLTVDGDLITVDMGPAAGARRDRGRGRARSWPARHVDMGNPHAVAFVDDLDEAGRAARGARRTTPATYPDGVNVEFVVRRGERHVAMRVHERGSGETRSCGTGACAVMVAAALGRRRPSRRRTTYRVDVPGGTLTVAWTADDRVLLTGPAVLVAEGVTDL